MNFIGHAMLCDQLKVETVNPLGYYNGLPETGGP